MAAPALAFCGAAVTHAEHAYRRGGLAVLAAIAEGCGELLRRQLPAVLPAVVRCNSTFNRVINIQWGFQQGP